MLALSLASLDATGLPSGKTARQENFIRSSALPPEIFWSGPSGPASAENQPNYGRLVDMGNFICADDDPGDGWIHTRNGNYIRGTVAGHGVVSIRRCLSILKENGYQGVVSYEFEGHKQNLPALRSALKFIRKAAE